LSVLYPLYTRDESSADASHYAFEVGLFSRGFNEAGTIFGKSVNISPHWKTLIVAVIALSYEGRFRELAITLEECSSTADELSEHELPPPPVQVSEVRFSPSQS